MARAETDTTLSTGVHPLDNAVHSALTGPHAGFAQRHGNVLRYPAEVCSFLALPDSPQPQDWADLAALVGPATPVVLGGLTTDPPATWTSERTIPLRQYVDDGIAAAPDDELVPLTPADVPEMLALVEWTQPGPFLPRTIEMGVYLGLRRDGELVAMAGERLHLTGWTEISGVCTEDSLRGQGIGTRLVLAVAAGIRARGETAFLHVVESNTNAIRLYEALGFRLRLTTTLRVLITPAEA